MLVVGVVLGLALLVELESVVVVLPVVLAEELLVTGPDTVADVVVGPLVETPLEVELVAGALVLIDDEELLLPDDPLDEPVVELLVVVAIRLEPGLMLPSAVPTIPLAVEVAVGLDAVTWLKVGGRGGGPALTTMSPNCSGVVSRPRVSMGNWND